jgi:hypothetical protein
VDELRAGGPRLVRVDLAGAARGWGDSLPGVEVAECVGERTVFRLAPDTDPQQILDAARRAGTVTHFAELQPSLADLFRELVST